MFFVFTILLQIVSASIVIRTTSGPIRGFTTPSADVVAFLGIPFAEPPVGKLRFAKPVPKGPWTETLQALSFSPPCAQISPPFLYYFSPNTSSMSEDCLYLNVWTRTPISVDKLKPVVVFFHDGGFFTGSASMPTFIGEQFVRHSDMVVVTVNYRVGAFGFLYLGTDYAEGNMGLYDQVVAVRWFKDNAVRFGGNPNDITLFGSSAGAASVAMHMISPVSKNLFQKAIMHSSSAVEPFFYENSRQLKVSRNLVRNLGCVDRSNKTKSEVVACLKNLSAEAIVRAERVLINTHPVHFLPRVHDEFLPESTIRLLRAGLFRGDIPVLTGIVNDEGPLFLITAVPEYFGVYGRDSAQIRKSNTVVIVRGLLDVAKVLNPSEVLNFYLSQVKNRTSAGYIRMIADLVGDYSVACGTLFQADIFSLKGNSIYFYKFKFRSPSTPMAEWVGVTHLDEMQYIFGNPYHQNFTEEESELSKRLMERWSAFVRTGNPNLPDQLPWPCYTYQKPFYLSIEQEGESIRMKPLERCKVWRERFQSSIDSDLIRSLQSGKATKENMATKSLHLLGLLVSVLAYQRTQNIMFYK